MKCPVCNGMASKAISLGLPFYICQSVGGCGCRWGPASWLHLVRPFSGSLTPYEGSYWPALWVWLRSRGEGFFLILLLLFLLAFWGCALFILLGESRV